MPTQEFSSIKANIAQLEQESQKLRIDVMRLRPQSKRQKKLSIGCSVMALIMCSLFYGFVSAGRQDNTFMEIFRYIGALFTASFTVTSGNKALNNIFELIEFHKKQNRIKHIEKKINSEREKIQRATEQITQTKTY